MRGPYDDEDKATTPFPTAPVSNGEWVPGEITDKQKVVEKLIAEEAGDTARRHGLTRSQFLKTAAGTMLGFSALNRVHGLDAWGDNAVLPVRKVDCEDLDAARERLSSKPFFIVDVQTHHVDLDRFGDVDGMNNPWCFLRFCREEGEPACSEDQDIVGQANYIREMLVDSETHVSVVSGLPGGVPNGPDKMAETAALANQLADSGRCLTQAMVDPAGNNADTGIETMERQVNELGGRALKCYTYNGNWRLDSATAEPMLAEAERLGLPLINCHKGLPAIFAPGSEESVRTTDFPGAVRAFPNLKFCAYHSGYYTSPENHPEGKGGMSEFMEIVKSLTRKERKRVYAEVGSTFAINLISDGVGVCGRGGPPPTGPLAAAAYIGELLDVMGSKNILWGTDSIWWGSPQWLIDAFKVMQIPASLREQFGYPQLTKKAKKRIFGKNAAKLYGIKKRDRKKLCTIPPESVDALLLANAADDAEMTLPDDRLTRFQTARGGPHEHRSLTMYGPQTRRDFIKRFGWSYG